MEDPSWPEVYGEAAEFLVDRKWIDRSQLYKLVEREGDPLPRMYTRLALAVLVIEAGGWCLVRIFVHDPTVSDACTTLIFTICGFAFLIPLSRE
jgi:hypothetical protein